MKTIRYKEYGDIDVLHLVDVDKPSPKEGEVLVKVFAASLNDWDTSMSLGVPYFMRLFTGLFKPKLNYQYPGCDVAGVIESVGSKASQFNIGDKVFGDLCKSGFASFAEYVCVPDAALAPMPDKMTFEQAACLPQAGQLAVQGLLDTNRLEAGKKLLINGAGGGVGTLGVQMVKHMGCDITVVDTAEKLDMLLSLGADHAIDYEKQDFCKAGIEYDLIVDTKTTRSPFSHNKALKRGGLYATLGGSSLWFTLAALLNPLIYRLKGKQHQIVMQSPNKDLALLSEMYTAGTIVPVIDSAHDLVDFGEAYERFLSARQKGKVIILMNQATN